MTLHGANFAEILKWLVDEAHKALRAGESVMRLWIGAKLIVLPLDPDAFKVNILLL